MEAAFYSVWNWMSHFSFCSYILLRLLYDFLFSKKFLFSDFQFNFKLQCHIESQWIVDFSPISRNKNQFVKEDACLASFYSKVAYGGDIYLFEV